MIILGAGLAGCLAGALERRAKIFEAGAGPSKEHKAVLRHRDDKIAEALGIPFKRVTVYKAVFFDGSNRTHVTPDMIVLYSRKVTGQFSERSITSLETVQRWVAPNDLHQILADLCGGRIEWNSPVISIPKTDEPILSTIPLPKLLQLLQEPSSVTFQHEAIHVERWRVPGSSLHMTIYFPSGSTDVYRATLTGEDLIIERMAAPPAEEDLDKEVLVAFGLRPKDVQFVEFAEQRYGKIIPLENNARKQLLLMLTMKYNIYSLGRFACWRNILLDDVYEDFFTIRKMLNLNHYDLIRNTV